MLTLECLTIEIAPSPGGIAIVLSRNELNSVCCPSYLGSFPSAKRFQFLVGLAVLQYSTLTAARITFLKSDLESR